jgi:hypothetical protein
VASAVSVHPPCGRNGYGKSVLNARATWTWTVAIGFAPVAPVWGGPVITENVGTVVSGEVQF